MRATGGDTPQQPRPTRDCTLNSIARAPFNVLVLPYRGQGAAREFAVLHRSDGDIWQFIAGGGEGREEPLATARREAIEEAEINGARDWLALDARASIPRTAYPDAPWAESILVIPEICFAVHFPSGEIRLSSEHDRVEWLDYETARERLTWDSNRVALWELEQRLDAASRPRGRSSCEPNAPVRDPPAA